MSEESGEYKTHSDPFDAYVAKMDKEHPDWLKGNATSLMAVAREFWDAGIQQFLSQRYNAASKLASSEPPTQEVIEIDKHGKAQQPIIELNPHSSESQKRAEASALRGRADNIPASERTKRESEPQEWTPETLARFFHETYETLAPGFGYETRPETREFNPESKNGRLMVAVCDAVLIRFNAELATEREQVKFWQREHTAAHARHIQAEKELTSNV
jgi:hypothetical protein